MFRKVTALAVVSLLAQALAADFSSFNCFKPVIKGSTVPVGACCEKLVQYAHSSVWFAYAGKNCLRSASLSPTKEGENSFFGCPADRVEACCDAAQVEPDKSTSPTCLLPLNGDASLPKAEETFTTMLKPQNTSAV
ncbi:hypothetical protein V2A60_002696 [Cordyceps javanica]|uniref:Uncharacterized protein n=1 Tax=Cordyceps javanica TaxID=43265 RepID=A0A545UXR5_9HYPO|nr:hypothetical protein IF1G_07143 [Cordyceps javanica]